MHNAAVKNNRTCTKDKNNKRSWYLIFTRSKSELRAQENLDRQGFITYMPVVKNNRKRCGVDVKYTEAFFSRYLFINLDSKHDNWAPINSTIGVSKLVRFGSLPANVPEKLIESLRLNEDNAGFQQVMSQKLKPGDNVDIIDGLFTGHQGIYQQPKSSDRIVILLDIIGKNTQVILNMNELKIT